MSLYRGIGPNVPDPDHLKVYLLAVCFRGSLSLVSVNLCVSLNLLLTLNLSLPVCRPPEILLGTFLAPNCLPYLPVVVYGVVTSTACGCKYDFIVNYIQENSIYDICRKHLYLRFELWSGTTRAVRFRMQSTYRILIRGQSYRDQVDR